MALPSAHTPKCMVSTDMPPFTALQSATAVRTCRKPPKRRTPQLSASSSVFSTDTISSISHYCGYQRKKTSPARTVRPWPLPPKRLINVVSLFLSSCKPASKHCGQHNTMHSRTHTQIPETTPPARKQTRQPHRTHARITTTHNIAPTNTEHSSFTSPTVFVVP